MTEADIMRNIMVAISAAGHRAFRNNCGSLKDPRGMWVRFGVANPGGSDLIGWTHAGRFLAIEVKTATGRVRPEQIAFIKTVREFGGYAGIARSAQDAQDIASGQIRD